MKYISVNHLLVLFCIFFVFFLGCGFQLNRNRIQLINEAKSIAVYKISNSSYTAGLDVSLKAKLIQNLEQKTVPILPPQRSDLVCYFDITSFNIAKSKYALDADTNVQTYQFEFTIKGYLTVLDNRYKQTDYSNSTRMLSETGIGKNKTGSNIGTKQYRAIDRRLVEGSYNLKTTDEDLEQTDSTEGKTKAVAALNDRIIETLSLSF